MDGINAGRKTIPFASFDKKRTAQGVECLRSYRTEWDEKARAFKKTPDHNWASHGADGWRYLSIAWRAPMREPEPEPKPASIPMNAMTMDQLMAIEDDRAVRRINSYLGDHRQDELNKPNIVIEARGDQAAAKRSTTRWMAVSAR